MVSRPGSTGLICLVGSRRGAERNVGSAAVVALMCGKPPVRRPESFDERDPWGPAEFGEPLHVKKPAGRAVRLAGIPANIAAVTDYARDEVGQFGDCELFAAAHVDRSFVVVVVQQEVAGVGEIVDVQELPPGLPGSPAR